MRYFFSFTKLVLAMAIACLSSILIINPTVNMRTLAVLVGLIGFSMIFNGISLDNLNLAETLKKDFKIVEIQNFILSEVKKNNTQVISLITAQADLLSKMTYVAMSKTELTAELKNKETNWDVPK